MTRIRDRINQYLSVEAVTASILLVVSLAYLSHVFQLSRHGFWTSGMGDWMDPYFINALLEHWYRSVGSATDPSSPPMFFPARQTLGNSHGLVLFAPFYLALRSFLHPFQAYNATLFVVIEIGIICLYVLFRKSFRLSFVESLLLTALFFTSENVVNGATGIWSQRASVFLIPPILLILFAWTRLPDGRPRLVLALLWGVLASLLFTQDFYTAQFALFFVVFAIAVVLFERRGRLKETLMSSRKDLISVARGVIIGLVVFLWIYLAAYREHPSFPDSDVMNALAPRDPFRWNNVSEFLRDLRPYDTLRSFKLVFVAGVLSWVPWFRVDRRIRVYGLLFLLLSFIVLLIPLRFDDFSIWKVFVAPLPGFGVIRDPKRVIYLYELAAVLAIGLLLSKTGRPALRIVITLLLLFFIATDRNREVFQYSRPIEVYERWVGAPIRIDRSCESFFITRASKEYTSRSDNMWTLYNIDAMFVALNHSIPTLNGYSAWPADRWNLFNPEEEVYPERVRLWIERHGLTGVCELDLVARTMTPYSFPHARR